jgi:hypothetical protein
MFHHYKKQQQMIREYIDSGILETYVMGVASEQEIKELMRMKAKYPEISQALQQLELDMERIADHMAITPPPTTWNKIEQEINDLIPRPETKPEKFTQKSNGQTGNESGHNYIEVESESNHMRIHKNWKWVFAAVFVLGKIFLGFAIYFYLENRQSQQQLNELKTEIRQLKK